MNFLISSTKSSSLRHLSVLVVDMERKKSMEEKSIFAVEELGEDDEIRNGCEWRGRWYRCGFCKKQFRCAQALGGHMNVHRRERARLRRSPPHHHFYYNITTLPPPPPPPSAIPFLPLFSTTTCGKSDIAGCRTCKNKPKNLDMEISLVGTSKDIDLELRLGYL